MTDNGLETLPHMGDIPADPKPEETEEKCSNNNVSVDELNKQIAQLTAKCTLLESKLDMVTKQKDLAQKEKESMVVKYAMSEKNVLDMKHQKDQIEKKYKDLSNELEISQHKYQMMCTEKSRICQMLDNKCYELKSSQEEVEQLKVDLNALELKLKWSQNNLKTEIQSHKECQSKVEELLKEINEKQENNNPKEQQAALILLRHEKDDKEQIIKSLNSQLEKLQTKQKDMLQENNNLSLKVQQLERDRLENEQKLSELKASADQQRQDCADLQAKTALLDQFKLQLKNEQDQNRVCNEQIQLLKQRNAELENDIAACRDREAELLLFTQQLTDKNVRLQSEFTALETKVQQLGCEQNLSKRALKEQETKSRILVNEVKENAEELERLKKILLEKNNLIEELKQEVNDRKGENLLLKRKYDLSLKEINKELQQYRKKLEVFESEKSSSSSNTSLNEQVKVIQPDGGLDRQTLIEHIVKLQKISAKKSEKIDFLEEHVNSLVLELQKKSRLLQSYILRDQSGTLTSNTMDTNKANIAKLNGIMASVYSCRVADDNLTLELSLDINRKLQAVLEDALLKNITLKENVDTLGSEIDRLNKLLKS